MNSVLKAFSLNECTEILKQELQSEIFKVDSFQIYPLEEKVGFLAEHYYLKVEYSVNHKRKIVKFFVKCMISSEAERQFVLETGVFYKECRMFQELITIFLENNIDIIEECIPKCYMSSLNDDFLIFEDLGSKGYINMDHRKGLNVNYVKSVLKTLAKFHASTIIMEEKLKQTMGKEFTIRERYPNLFQETFYTTSLQSSMEILKAVKKGAATLIDLFGGAFDVNLSLFKRLTSEVFDQFPEIVKPSNIFRNTICHSDLWSSNIMFKFENENSLECRLVDFQSYRYAPPAQDLLAFLYLSTDRRCRKEHLANMIYYYYGEISKELMEYKLGVEEILPKNEFRSSCDYYKTFAIAQTMNHYPMIMIPKEELKTIFSDQKNVRKFFFEDRTEVILKMCSKDKEYAERLRESIEDLEEVFVEKRLL